MPAFVKTSAGNRSTGDKQTSKGLFLCCPPKGKFLTGDPEVLIFLPLNGRTFGHGNIFYKKELRFDLNFNTTGQVQFAQGIYSA